MSKTRQNIVCPLCTKRGSDLPHFPLHLYCKTCRLAWLRQFPKTTYDDTYYTGASTIASKLFAPIALFFYVVRSAYAGFSRKGLWIDVGAGDGSFLKTVNAKRKIGVDISASARKIMGKKGIATMANRKFLFVRHLNADVISFWHMLEHVPNPWDYLRAAKNNLKKNGLVVIGVPNMDCLEYHLFGNRYFHTPKFHLYENTPHSINKLLKRSGFRIRSIDYWSPEHHLPSTLQSIINVTAGSQGALHRFIRRGHDPQFHPKDAFWSMFWMTIGLPLVVLFWIAGALLGKSSTIVVVASAEK